jgi:hypothetical protein
MTDQAPSTTSSLESSSIALAFVLHSLKLRETADAVAFETLMLEEVFPEVDTRGSGVGDMDVAPDQHFLLAGRSFDEYVWMIRLEYFVHHTPLPTWLGNRARDSYAGVKAKIEQVASRTSTELLYDVKEWHQRLGMS